MASTNKTDKLKLNKWLGSDKIQRVDFNNDNDIIETEFLDRGVNVKWFGAVGDGATDDTTAIQNAFNSASGKTVIIPDGVYNISSKLLLPYNTSLKMSKGTTLKATVSIDYIIEWNLKDGDTGNYHTPNNFIEGGYLDGNDLASCLFIKEFHVASIRYISFLNGKVYGLKVGNTSEGSYNLTCENLHFQCFTTTNLNNTGIQIDGSGDNFFTNIMIVNYTQGVISNTGGNRFERVHVWLSHTERYNLSKAFQNYVGESIYINCFADTMKTGWYIQSSARLVGCHGYNNASYGLNDIIYVYLDNTYSPKLTITDCWFKGTTTNNRFMYGTKSSRVRIDENCQFEGLSDVDDNSTMLDSYTSPGITSQYYNFGRITIPKSRNANSCTFVFELKTKNATNMNVPQNCELKLTIKGDASTPYLVATAEADNYDIASGLSVVSTTDSTNLYFDLYFYSSVYDTLRVKLKQVVGNLDDWSGSLNVASTRFYILNKIVQLFNNDNTKLLSSIPAGGTTISITGKAYFNVAQIKIGNWYIWDDGTGNLRKKNSPPANLTDGTIIA